MMTNKTYVVGTSPLIIYYNGFVPGRDCGAHISYTWALSNGDPLPSFIVPNPNSNGLPGGYLNVSMGAVVNVPQPVYFVYLKASSNAIMPADDPNQHLITSTLLIPITLVIPNLGPVKFENPPKDYEVTVGGIISIELPPL